MKKKTYKEKNTIIMTALLIAAICAIFAGTTYAFLSASTTNNPVTNTFIAAGGGNIVDPDIPTGETSNFYLNESLASLNQTKDGYTLDTTQKVTTNNYEGVVPGITISKDPALTLDISTDVYAYVYVEIVDGTKPSGSSTSNITYQVTSDWNLLSGITGANGGAIYLYNNAAVLGVDGKELDAKQILANNRVSVSNNLVDVDPTTSGIQLGTLKLYAYVTQSAGFSDAASAYTASFPSNNG